MKYVIVAIGYNRIKSLVRLVNSLLTCDYYGEQVDLVISIDKSDAQDEIARSIKDIKWEHGKKEIVKRQERLGLRNHVLACGDIVIDYDAIIMLEDDLVVSPFFFTYVRQTVSFYKNDTKIAGISLYKHETHPGVYRPFIPDNNGYDAFLMQFAQSWGQCWTKDMWLEFRKWYNLNQKKDLGCDDLLPRYISSWNHQSWLKYFMRFVVESNKFFVYPYVSLSTNSSESGEHNSSTSNDFQVPLLMGKCDYRLPEFDRAVRYDVYFERCNPQLSSQFNIDEDYIIDLYGKKRNYDGARFLFSTAILPYKIIKEIQLKYRPAELNLLFPEDGKGIYLYDLSVSEIRKDRKKDYSVRYDVRAIEWNRLMRLSFEELMEIIKWKIKQ